ncbi:hypothetical protein [Paludisphaera mucosa]|uniref:Uncharacterized protein n=1 Tax=Paludisphaera mucosa TaxID=3030827 RepID=A0ABT6FLJ8_9BACT|nr:hypothetical protein [Paludisphaera mucosa]MDG3008453.1 hypothetical protein [Paludisphaera mucosa]
MNEERRRDRMTELAKSFPCLRDATGVSPWEPTELDRWAVSGVSHGERAAASFVLAVWDSSTEWGCGRFELMEALNVWPESHREPFLAWAKEPWWP